MARSGTNGHKKLDVSTTSIKVLLSNHLISFSNLFYSLNFWLMIDNLKCLYRRIICFCIVHDIQMQADAITHLKYWFQISSILERTKNSTKTNNTSYERSDSGLSYSWKFGAWHSYWPATPTLYDKLNFLGIGGMASSWCCHAPVLQEYFCPLSGL